MTIISIIIPVYNVEKYIEQCLRSVMNQTLSKEEGEIECILVDDCSPDNSMQIVKGMIEEYQGEIQFTCLVHEINKGLSAARNTGLAKAKGEYVFFLDSDDYIAENCFLSFIKAMKLYPNTDLFIGQVVKKPSNDFYSVKTEQYLIYNNKTDIQNRYFSGDFYTSAWNKLVKRSILKKNHINFVEDIIFEDTPWMHQLFTNINSLILIPETTYFYNTNPLGIMSTLTSERQFKRAIKSYSYLVNFQLDNFPNYSGFCSHAIVDYLLILHNILSRREFLLTLRNCPKDLILIYSHDKKRLSAIALKRGRLLIAGFTLILYKPFNILFKFSIFRKHYYQIQEIIKRISHVTDFVHIIK